jgi:regulator of replication initiation timing
MGKWNCAPAASDDEDEGGGHGHDEGLDSPTALPVVGIRGTIPRATSLTAKERQRMAKQAVARAVDLEPIDRLEDKVRMLVSVVTQLRQEQSRSADENARLTQEVDVLRARLSEAEATATELGTLRDEREEIKTRVTEMLQQLEAIQ